MFGVFKPFQSQFLIFYNPCRLLFIISIWTRMSKLCTTLFSLSYVLCTLRADLIPPFSFMKLYEVCCPRGLDLVLFPRKRACVAMSASLFVRWLLSYLLLPFSFFSCLSSTYSTIFCFLLTKWIIMAGFSFLFFRITCFSRESRSFSVGSLCLCSPRIWPGLVSRLLCHSCKSVVPSLTLSTPRGQSFYPFQFVFAVLWSLPSSPVLVFVVLRYLWSRHKVQGSVLDFLFHNWKNRLWSHLACSVWCVRGRP